MSEFQKLLKKYQEAGDRLLACPICSRSGNQCENHCTDNWVIAYNEFKQMPGGYGYEHRARILKGMGK